MVIWKIVCNFAIPKNRKVMETNVLIILLIIVAIIFLAGGILICIEAQNAEVIDPDKPFLRGDEGYPED